MLVDEGILLEVPVAVALERLTAQLQIGGLQAAGSAAFNEGQAVLLPAHRPRQLPPPARTIRRGAGSARAAQRRPSHHPDPAVPPGTRHPRTTVSTRQVRPHPRIGKPG